MAQWVTVVGRSGSVSARLRVEPVLAAARNTAVVAQVLLPRGDDEVLDEPVGVLGVPPHPP